MNGGSMNESSLVSTQQPYTNGSAALVPVSDKQQSVAQKNLDTAAMPAPDTLTLEHLSTVDVKQLLHLRGLSTYGDRASLLIRLRQRMVEELPTEAVWAAARGVSQRRGASVVVYEGCIYQFGGIDTNHVDYNTLHKWSQNSAGFEIVQTKGKLPKPRWTHVALVHDHYMYVFGGFYGYAGKAKPTGRLSDLWRYDFTTGWWNEVGGMGAAPSPRSHQSFTLVGRDRAILFGGVSEEEVRVGGFSIFDTDSTVVYETVHMNDVYMFDFKSLSWSLIQTTGPRPFGGLRAVATVSDDYLFTLGWRQSGQKSTSSTTVGSTDFDGEESESVTYTFEMWKLSIPRVGDESDIQQWEEVHARGNSPTPRDNYSACKVGDSWIVHGGRDVFGEIKCDTYEYSFTTGVWDRLLAKGIPGVVPDVRYLHKAVAYEKSMFIVGGCSKYAVNHNLLVQRCSAVEQLFLSRPMPPAEGSGPKKDINRRLEDSQKVGNKVGAVQKLKEAFGAKPITNSGMGGPPPTSAVSDVALICNGMRIHAHRSVLCSQSTRFKALLDASPKEVALTEHPFVHLSKVTYLLPLLAIFQVIYAAYINVVFAFMGIFGKGGTRVIRVRDVPYKVLLVMLQYMYNCLEEIDEELLVDVFKAGEKYGIMSLKLDCLHHMIDMVDISNIGYFLQVADETKNYELEAATHKFARLNWSAVVKSPSYLTLLKSYPQLGQRIAAEMQNLRLKDEALGKQQ